MIERFGTLPDGRIVQQITLANEQLNVSLITYGASLQQVKFGEQNVLLSGETLEEYLGDLAYSGAIVGRASNRIAKARAHIAGQEHRFDVNEDNGNCLHGGSEGSGQMLWTLADHSRSHAVLNLHMPDGHMGFPGALDVSARYELDGAALRLNISAQSDQETLCAFASHGYWTLSDAPHIDALELQIAAEQYLPVDDAMIPTGRRAPVHNTSFDFRKMREIGGAEMDHNFCIRAERGALKPVLWLQSKASGVAMEVASTEAGVQVYDARHMARAALAIEPQVWPDAINQSGFPNMVLKPDETYESLTEFRFSKRAHA